MGSCASVEEQHPPPSVEATPAGSPTKAHLEPDGRHHHHPARVWKSITDDPKKVQDLAAFAAPPDDANIKESGQPNCGSCAQTPNAVVKRGQMGMVSLSPNPTPRSRSPSFERKHKRVSFYEFSAISLDQRPSPTSLKRHGVPERSYCRMDDHGNRYCPAYGNRYCSDAHCIAEGRLLPSDSPIKHHEQLARGAWGFV